MNTTSTSRIVRLGLAATAAALALPIGNAAAARPPEPAEHGTIERQCEADKGTFFSNTYGGDRNLVCSGPDFRAGARPALMTCDRMGGSFTFIGIAEPQSWRCDVPIAGRATGTPNSPTAETERNRS